MNLQTDPKQVFNVPWIWSWSSVKNISNMYIFRKYVGDWPKCSLIWRFWLHFHGFTFHYSYIWPEKISHYIKEHIYYLLLLFQMLLEITSGLWYWLSIDNFNIYVRNVNPYCKINESSMLVWVELEQVICLELDLTATFQPYFFLYMSLFVGAHSSVLFNKC